MQGKGRDAYSHEISHGPATLRWIVVDIGEHAARDGNGSSSRHAIEESEHQQRRIRSRQGAGHGEDVEQDEADEQGLFAAILLGDWTAEERADDVADEEDGDGQDELCLVRDVEIVGDVLDGAAGQRRPDGAVHDLHHAGHEGEELFALPEVSGGNNRR